MSKKNGSNDWLSQHPDRPSIQLDALLDFSLDKVKFKVISDEQVTLDDSLAASYIELPVFRGERNISENHVQKLYDEMAGGRFNPMLVILAICELRGTVYKINGQHTCWAKFYATGYEPKVRQIKFRVDSEEEMRMLYATFDRNYVRSEKHLTLVELANVEEFRHIPPSVIKSVAAGAKLWMFDTLDSRRRCGHAELAAMITEKHNQLFQAVCQFYTAHMHNKDTAHMRRVAVIAALCETFNKVMTIAPTFWKPVCDGVGIDSKNDPRWQLRNWLQNARNHTTSIRGLKVVGEEEMYNHCIPAFNKWRKGETVTVLRPTQARIRAV